MATVWLWPLKNVLYVLSLSNVIYSGPKEITKTDFNMRKLSDIYD